MKILISIVLFFVILLSSGCLSLTPKRDVMKTNIAKVSTRKTSRPVMISSQGEVVAVGQSEVVESNVEYEKVTPIVKSRSIWTRWWFWGLIIIGITYFGLWPLVISFARRLKRKTKALVSVVKQVDVFKDAAKLDPRKDDVNELKSLLKTSQSQDPVTRDEVSKIRNGG